MVADGLTDDRDVRIDREHATPRDGGQVGPLLVHRTWGAGEEFVNKREDHEADNLGYDARRDRQALDEEIGDINV